MSTYINNIHHENGLLIFFFYLIGSKTIWIRYKDSNSQFEFNENTKIYVDNVKSFLLKFNKFGDLKGRSQDSFGLSFEGSLLEDKSVVTNFDDGATLDLILKLESSHVELPQNLLALNLLSLKEWIKQYKIQPKVAFEKDKIISGFGKDFPFVGRKQSSKLLKATVRDRWKSHKNQEDDQKVHPIMVVAGAPGTGKTRFLLEFPRIISKSVPEASADSVYLYLTYGNGEPLSKLEFRDIVSGFSLRILHNYFRIRDPLVLFIQQWFDTWDKELPLLLVLALIKEVEEKESLTILLAIDEFQKLLQDSSVTSKDIKVRRKHLRDIRVGYDTRGLFHHHTLYRQLDPEKT
ncbi:hypothetical protein DFA_04308 [Cavenderia fasciculata]|uniref:Uncharacterized protein n=1 Tax=Cavenderia fasciculata TaxID=261658 RepID=F4PP77_CACFS|nr:uncharacterized protein DFA_04308 [Cavenderia fasciculata]EGG22190.1 hypothetical protein DFA_04308 [Cavenderia fasciculata]|eukprot:XP_004360041.1 hypothetical protein DFA_04308 [Cavenderia fasciculata]